MPKQLGKQHAVQSSNLKSIGCYKTEDNSLFVRIEFQRGADYNYQPVTEKEFQEAFAPGTVLKDWFAKFKVGKQFKKVE